MILQLLHCPHCHGTDIVRHGTTRQGKQRYRCREQRCAGRTFLLHDSYRGQAPAVQEQIVDMGYPFNAGHSAPSITCREGLTTLPGHRQLLDV